MQTETLRTLIMSERVVPGALLNLGPPSPGVKVSLNAHAMDMHLSGPIYADGPYGATLVLDASDINELAPHRSPYDHSGYEQTCRATVLAADEIQRRFGGRFRVHGRDGKIIVRAIR